SLKGFNIHALAIQVPSTALAAAGDATKNPIVGVWTTAERQSVQVISKTGKASSNGTYVQVSRLGMPLVNEVVIPVGLKDYFNSSKPSADGAARRLGEAPEAPHLLHALYHTPIPASDPDTPGIQRADLIQVFLTGVASLNMP